MIAMIVNATKLDCREGNHDVRRWYRSGVAYVDSSGRKIQPMNGTCRRCGRVIAADKCSKLLEDRKAEDNGR
jgi:hypothetical protein